MLSLPSIQTVAPAPLAKPLLVVDAVRPSSPQKSVEPANAISKERSRAENRLPEPGMTALAELAASSSVALKRVGQSGRPAADNKAVLGRPASEVDDEPPSEKTAIQKALDTQVKSLLSNVWRASAKAVDFLLGRDAVERAEAQREAAIKRQADFWPILQSASDGQSPRVSSDAGNAGSAVVSYTSKGETNTGIADARGQLVDVVA